MTTHDGAGSPAPGGDVAGPGDPAQGGDPAAPRDSAESDVTLPAAGDVVARIRAHAAELRAGEHEEGGPSDPDERVGSALDADSADVLDEIDDDIDDDIEDEIEVWTSDTFDDFDLTPAPANRRPSSTPVPHESSVPRESAVLVTPAPRPPARLRHAAPDRRFAPENAAAFTREMPIIAPREPVVVDDAPATPSRPVSLIDGVEPPALDVSFWQEGTTFRASGIDTPVRVRRGRERSVWGWVAAAVLVIVLLSIGVAFLLASGSTS